MTVGVKDASICVSVIVRYMYAAFVMAKVRPCAAPIGIMFHSQNWNVILPMPPSAASPPPDAFGVVIGTGSMPSFGAVVARGFVHRRHSRSTRGCKWMTPAQ